jgi:hypothetical protein
MIRMNKEWHCEEDGGSGLWNILKELVEKESIPQSMDLLGIFIVPLTEEGEMVGYLRRGRGRRKDREKEV